MAWPEAEPSAAPFLVGGFSHVVRVMALRVMTPGGDAIDLGSGASCCTVSRVLVGLISS
jgi:hypothetical protein